jgi:FkbM family methyltransferase
LARGLALIESMQRVETAACTIFVVCMDEMTHIVLRRLALPNVRPVPLHDVESHDEELLAAKPTRSLVEYYWTLTPTVVLRILERHPEIDQLTYLDADLLFFSSPQPLFDELSEASILIHEHRFSDRQKALATHSGRFNVGLMTFRRDAHGLAALRWWRMRCLEWCFARYEQGKMGDQLYLNDWPERFQGVVVLAHPGGGVAPWNHDQYDIGLSATGEVTVDQRPLIFYHFHSLKVFNADCFLPVAHAHYLLTLEALRYCFVPYVEQLAKMQRRILDVMPNVRWGLEEAANISSQITFMAHRGLRERVVEASKGHRLVPLTDRWDVYCSDQILKRAPVEGRSASTSSVPARVPTTPRVSQPENTKARTIPTVPSQHDLLHSLLQPEVAKKIRTLYVIGAHRYQERALFDQLFPNVERIYLFEPIPGLVEELRRLATHDHRITVFPYALSNENGTREFFLTNNDGESSSLLRLGKHKEIFPHVREVSSIQVPCRTLDRVIEEYRLADPDMLLLDVQGAEYQILSSLSARLKNRVLLLYVEASLEEVYAGAKCLDDLRAVLEPDHDLVAFAPLGPSSPTHGNALFVNHRLVRPAVQSSPSDQPLISVIVSSYCAEAFMRECLQDLERQTVIDRMEIIVVDAASPQQEGAIVLQFQQQHGNIVYLRTPTRIGVYAAWNMAIKLARGRYVTPFSTNDRLRRDAYELLARALDDHPDVALVYGDTYLTATAHQTFERHDRIGNWKWPDYSYEYLLKHCCVGPHPMWRRDLHETLGYFDESYVALGDQDFWIRIGAKHRMLHIPVVTGLYWHSPDGLSNRAEIAGPEERRLRQTYNLDVPKPESGFDCSVIIPAWNKCELTRDCVTALAKTTGGLSWELIIVDNHSTDGTAEFLEQLGGDVQIIRNQENLGFAKACNQGARAARGKYLVFLNNDTVPLDGWLQAMVEEVRTHADVGIVGSKLLYADGTVQHAGVACDRSHCAPYHIYRTFPGDHPAVNRRREFHVVTGACLLIRAELFRELGGFDEAFRNGFEDVDLCLKARERGYRVVYQPKSALFHLESQTPGRKAYDKANSRRLQERWGDSWWLSDEDLQYFEDGYKTIVELREGQPWMELHLLADEQEKAQWKMVAETQQAARNKDFDAVKACLHAVAQWPRDRGVLKWAATICERLQEPALQAAFLTRCLEGQDDPSVRLALIHSLIKQQEFPAAEQQVHALLATEPDCAEAWLIQAVLLMQREAYQAAREAFASALRYGADRTKCLKGEGMAAMGLADWPTAWSLFSQALVVDCDDSEAVHMLLRVGTAQERWGELGQVLLDFVVRNPGEFDIRFALAGVLLRAGRIESAKREYEALRTLAPTYDGLKELGRAINEKETAATDQAVNA